LFNKHLTPKSKQDHMKKMIFSTMMLAFAASSFGQQTAPKQNPNWQESDYYKKSKSQKTVAWVLVGTGAGLFVGGMIAHFNYINDGHDPLSGVDGTFTTGEAIAGVGILVASGSIPLFISSAKNKKRAKEGAVFIDMEHAEVLQGTAFSNRPFPALGLRLRF
jgi:hypothetical protein